MPFVGGRERAEWILSVSPDLPFTIVSAYAQTQLVKPDRCWPVEVSFPTLVALVTFSGRAW